MARYVVQIQSPRSPESAFDYMADLDNFAEWDPGVTAVTQADGDGPGPDAAYDVSIKTGPRDLVLRYRLVEYQPHSRAVARAESRLLTSNDIITVEPDPDGAGSLVTYDAELTLNGPLGLLDPVLASVFGKIGDRAAAGLLRALDGQKVEPSTG